MVQAQNWELFRVFDTIEFEINENNTTSAAFHSEGSISSQAAGVLASLDCNFV